MRNPFRSALRPVLALALMLTPCAPAATLYVNVNNPTPVPPFTNWATAAQVIQDAVDAAQAGDTVLVTNGVYDRGGRAVVGIMTNRVAVDKPIILQSVNGPEVTTIKGRKIPYSLIGQGAVRCAYLTNGAVLSGFTLTNGATLASWYPVPPLTAGGGLFCADPSALASNCMITLNAAHYGGGAYGGTLEDCTLVGNSASNKAGGVWSGTLNNCILVSNKLVEMGGGGAGWSILNNCQLTGNSGGEVGGAASCTLSNCILVSNQGVSGGAAHSTLTDCRLTANLGLEGGGASSSTLINCVLATNYASTGGGASRSTLINCLVQSNSASGGGGGTYSGRLTNCVVLNNRALHLDGGGANSSYLDNCLLTGNFALGRGGGCYQAVLNNCILTDNRCNAGGGAASVSRLTNCTLLQNSAAQGGGAHQSQLFNCIAHYNFVGTKLENYEGSTLHFSCTTPMPTNGTGNITNEPLFLDRLNGNFRLQSNSPCINAGDNSYSLGSTDMDGRPRIVGASVDMGTYEVQDEFTAWLQQFSFPTNGSADFTDPDSDGFNNSLEYRCGTVPTNAHSVLRLLPLVATGTNVVLIWPSGMGRNYFLEWSMDLSATPRFLPLATNVPGQPGTTTFTHTNGAGLGPCFYRVGVP